MADMTSTTMATWLPRVYSHKPTITYRTNVVLPPLMDHSWEPEIGPGKGDRVLIPGFTQNSSAKNRGAGTGTFGTGAAVTFDAETEAQTTLQVNRMYYKAFRQPIEAAAQAMVEYNPLLMRGHAEAIAIQVDADLAADNTNGLDAMTAVGTDNIDISEDDLFTCQTNLNNQNAPTADRYAVLSPASFASVNKIESVRNSLYRQTMGGLSAQKSAGYMGDYLTFGFYMSNNMEAGTNGKKNATFHREAIAYAEQVGLRVEADVNIEDGVYKQFITYMTCGFVLVKSAFGNELDGK